MISIAGFGTLTLPVALTPGYAAIGLWSLVLRFAGGVFGGGEYTSNKVNLTRAQYQLLPPKRKRAALPPPASFQPGWTGLVAVAVAVRVAIPVTVVRRVTVIWVAVPIVWAGGDRRAG